MHVKDDKLETRVQVTVSNLGYVETTGPTGSWATNMLAIRVVNFPEI